MAEWLTVGMEKRQKSSNGWLDRWMYGWSVVWLVEWMDGGCSSNSDDSI